MARHIVTASMESEHKRQLAFESRDPLHVLRDKEAAHVEALAKFAHGDFTAALDAAVHCMNVGADINCGDFHHYDLLPDVLLIVRICDAAGDAQGVETFCARAAEIAVRALAEHPDVRTSCGMLGIVAKLNFDHGCAGSPKLYRQWVRRCEEVYGPEHAVAADCLVSAASASIKEQAYERALDLTGRALVAQISVLGSENHPCVGDSFYNLGLLFCLLGKGDRAENSRRAEHHASGARDCPGRPVRLEPAVTEVARGTF